MNNESLLAQESTPGLSRTFDGLDAVTGAFSYSGRAILRRLFEAGRRVRTLTGQPRRGGDELDIEVYGLDFDDPASVALALQGVEARYKTNLHFR